MCIFEIIHSENLRKLMNLKSGSFYPIYPHYLVQTTLTCHLNYCNSFLLLSLQSFSKGSRGEGFKSSQIISLSAQHPPMAHLPISAKSKFFCGLPSQIHTCPRSFLNSIPYLSPSLPTNPPPHLRLLLDPQLQSCPQGLCLFCLLSIFVLHFSFLLRYN